MNNFKKLGQFKSTGRFFNEKNSSYRTPFQRDRDRIIHSASFRRLKHKTQVFVNTEGDHFRTRITHSIEVSQIARSIAKYLKLNDDLAETLSLAHDLGHICGTMAWCAHSDQVQAKDSNRLSMDRGTRRLVRY